MRGSVFFLWILICNMAVFAIATIAACGGVLSKRMADGKRWTARNLDVETEDSYCYDGNCREYGRLYTWESARLACQSLGRGWRLPADADWRQLAARYGGEAAYHTLLMGGDSGFGALLGGGRDLDGQFARKRTANALCASRVRSAWVLLDSDGGWPCKRGVLQLCQGPTVAVSTDRG